MDFRRVVEAVSHNNGDKIDTSLPSSFSTTLVTFQCPGPSSLDPKLCQDILRVGHNNEKGVLLSHKSLENSVFGEEGGFFL